MSKIERETLSDEDVVVGVRIKDCKDALMWYADKIGQIVPFVHEEPDLYMCKEPGGYKNIVYKRDAELVTIKRVRVQNENSEK